MVRSEYLIQKKKTIAQLPKWLKRTSNPFVICHTTNMSSLFLYTFLSPWSFKKSDFFHMAYNFLP